MATIGNTNTQIEITQNSITNPFQVRDVGNPNQIRWGRAPLANQDFLDCGLSIPRALWNLTDLTDASGNGVTLTNGGTTSPVEAKGITGTAGEARFFSGQGATPPFLSAPNTIKQKYGTWSVVFRTVKRGVFQALMAMYRISTDFSFFFNVDSSNHIRLDLDSDDGNIATYFQVMGSTDVCDGRWHVAQFSWDGSTIVVILDGRIEVVGTIAIGAAVLGPMYTGGTALLYIGSRQIDNLNPFFGAIDEAFVTSDIISLEQHRYLMAAKVPHTIPQTALASSRLSINIDRRKRTSNYTVQDFTDLGLAQPLVGYNFNTATLTADNYGSLGRTLANNNVVTEAPDIDGSRTGAANFQRASLQNFSASGLGLPATTAARTMRVTFKCGVESVAYCLMAYGTPATLRAIYVSSTTGLIQINDGAAVLFGSFVVFDRLWHQVVLVDDNAAADGLKQKVYVDGMLIASSTIAVVGPTLQDINGFRIGSDTGPDNYFLGQIAGVDICNYAMTAEEIRALYNKPGFSMGNRSPVDPVAAMVERYTDTHAYIIVPDDIPGTDFIELVTS